ncbi:MAG TPA: hypothetical protein VIH89_11865 [Candidatus Sulfotelmatobacter sp.]
MTEGDNKARKMSSSDLIITLDSPTESAEPVSSPAGAHSRQASEEAGQKKRRQPVNKTPSDDAADLSGDEPQHGVDRLA